MIKYDKISKIIITALMLGFMLWFGVTVARGVIGYDIFNPEAELSLKQSYPPAIKLQNIYLYANLALYTGVGYIVAFVSALLLLFRLKHYLKPNGWLFMAFSLFFLASPMHLYSIYLDYHLAVAVIQNGVRDFLSAPVQKYFFTRFTDVMMTTLSSLAFLANLTSFLFVIWKPLVKKMRV